MTVPKPGHARGFVIPIFLGLFALAMYLAIVPTASIVGSGPWNPTGSMATARDGHTATLLPNGKVLVVGGGDRASSTLLSSAELYDPITGTWSPTGSMATPRSTHTATLLPNGKVLVAGGGDGSTVFLASAELYDPTTGTWSPTGNMGTPRWGATATLLPNGKVLVAGGQPNPPVYTSTALSEIYDPVTGTWAPTGSMITPRHFHTATLLPNGKVLVTGGINGFVNYLSSAELYDPVVGSWSTTGSMSTIRTYHTASLLATGKVLIVGGADGSDAGVGGSASAELYDPVSGSFSNTGSLTDGRQGHAATVISDGKVLVEGGYSNSAVSPPRLASAEIYDPATGVWASAGSMGTVRQYPTSTLLPDGRVLVAGGANSNASASLASAELYGSASTSPPTPAPSTPAPNAVGGIVELVSRNDQSAGANWMLIMLATGLITVSATGVAFVRSRRFRP